MNKTLVGLVLIALLVGLGGGYALGYVIYQPQLQNLQNNLSNLSNDLDSLNASLVELFSGYADNLSDYQDQVSEEARLATDRLNTINSSLTDAQSSLTSLQNQLTSLQDQLTFLNSRLSSLNSTVEGIENRSWHSVFSISSSSNFTSGIFQLKGREFRVMLTASGQDALSWITIAIRFSNGTLCSYYGFSGIWTATNVEEELVQSGGYYLEVVSDQTDYDLILWDYY